MQRHLKLYRLPEQTKVGTTLVDHKLLRLPEKTKP